MSVTKQPAVLIVHGAYMTPEIWDSFAADLSRAGFIVRCPHLPTCGDAKPPKAYVDDDVAAVRLAATELADAGHPIIVLTHSYGGIVGSEAISEDLFDQRPSSTGRGGIVHLICLSSFLIQGGDTVMGALIKHDPMSDDILDFRDGTVSVTNAAETHFGDIEKGRAEELARRNVAFNDAADFVPSKRPWMQIPTTYVYCLKDRALHLHMQKAMVKAAIANGGTAPFETESLDSGHCPFLSRPAEVLAIIEKVWASARNEWSVK